MGRTCHKAGRRWAGHVIRQDDDGQDMSYGRTTMGRKCHTAGHVIRQDDDDLSRRVLLSEPGGKRPRGRPRLRWADGVEEDLARLGCRNWKIVALNWEGWRKLLKEAEDHPGL